MSEFTAKLVSKKSFKSRIPATQGQIEYAESELGLMFSKEYREYLAEFGCVSIYGHEFTGICKSARLDVINVTSEQKALDRNIPCDWYVIEETNVDGITVWQDSKGVVYAKAPNDIPYVITNSFSEYIDL